MEIRAARPADAAAVAELKVRAWRAAYAGMLPAERLAALDAAAEAEAWRGYLEAVPPEDRFWVAVEGGAVAGYARAGPCEDVDARPGLGEVHGLYVDPARIATGLGRALLEHAAADLAARGYDTLVVWHFVGNDRAAGFYERAGLRPDGTRRRSPHGVDEVRLRRPLGATGRPST
ncbi:MAG TPA: GNAT family N-acetyltransferase [Gaiellaceae bacterium]|nr:GNAT family N-acetyltransferase [Gaiellaceae bacterium]